MRYAQKNQKPKSLSYESKIVFPGNNCINAGFYMGTTIRSQ